MYLIIFKVLLQAEPQKFRKSLKFCTEYFNKGNSAVKCYTKLDKNSDLSQWRLETKVQGKPGF